MGKQKLDSDFGVPLKVHSGFMSLEEPALRGALNGHKDVWRRQASEPATFGSPLGVGRLGAAGGGALGGSDLGGLGGLDFSSLAAALGASGGFAGLNGLGATAADLDVLAAAAATLGLVAGSGHGGGCSAQTSPTSPFLASLAELNFEGGDAEAEASITQALWDAFPPLDGGMVTDESGAFADGTDSNSASGGASTTSGASHRNQRAVTLPAETAVPPPPPQEWAKITTVMMRNLPNKYTQRMLLNELHICGFMGTFDFLYLPIDPDTNANRGYAFLNFIDAGFSWMFKMTYEGRKMLRFNSNKVVSIVPATLQGFEANYMHYASSRVNRGDPSARPLFLREPSQSARQTSTDGAGGGRGRAAGGAGTACANNTGGGGNGRARRGGMHGANGLATSGNAMADAAAGGAGAGAGYGAGQDPASLAAAMGCWLDGASGADMGLDAAAAYYAALDVGSGGVDGGMGVPYPDGSGGTMDISKHVPQFCPNCGGKIQIQFQFCPQCGGPLPFDDATSRMAAAMEGSEQEFW